MVNQYVETCAINVHYLEDWTDACQATLGDVLDHAKSVFRKCTNGQLGQAGRCGGHVPFIDANCPADVQIIHTTVEGLHRTNVSYAVLGLEQK